MRTTRTFATAALLCALTLACGLPLGNQGASPSPPVAPIAAPPSTVMPPLPVAAPGTGVPRAQFLASWTTIVVRQLCTPQQYFRQCFTGVDEAQCTTLMTSSANNCIAQSLSQIPDPVAPGAAELVGQTLGACTGTAYEQALVMEHRRIDSAICNDASHWM